MSRHRMAPQGFAGGRSWGVWEYGAIIVLAMVAATIGVLAFTKFDRSAVALTTEEDHHITHVVFKAKPDSRAEIRFISIIRNKTTADEVVLSIDHGEPITVVSGKPFDVTVGDSKVTLTASASPDSEGTILRIVWPEEGEFR